MKIRYYCSRAQALGIGGVYKAVKKRVDRKVFAAQWRAKARSGKACHNWQQVSQAHNLPADFASFFTDLKAKPLLQKLTRHKNITNLAPTTSTDPFDLIDQASDICAGRINILAYEPFEFGTNSIDWHTDHQAARHGFSSPTSWKNFFYQDITVTSYQQTKNVPPGPDVKTCWELSRLHHLVTLGLAWQQAEQERADIYSATFKTHLTDWIDNNPYLLGINWVCPMEVAIRAINIIWAVALFADDQTLEASFWQRVVCSLHDHLHYLENNWETSDRPNNHYLADLLGHAYLTLFFSGDITLNYQTHIKIMIEQFDYQVFHEGTSYEGSTAYHKLVCEMLTHLYTLLELTHTFIPKTLISKQKSMKQFLADCTDHGGNLATIGDNDSGKIIFGIACKPQTTPLLRTYHEFGLTTVRTQRWHVTFRHAAYKQHQGSGHFHQDALAITISYKGQPIFVDPGSFVYTSHTTWRNYFRSWQHHNTFGLSGINTIPNTSDLFALTQKNQQAQPHVQHTADTITISDSYQHDKHLPIAHRRLDISQEAITITDWWQKPYPHFENKQPWQQEWNFVCAPELDVNPQAEGWFALQSSEKTDMIFLKSDAPLNVCKDILSPSYGQSRKTQKLTACMPFSLTPIQTTLRTL